MLTVILYEGKKYHAEVEILDDGFKLVSPIVYASTGQMVPAHICICESEDEDDCECGAYSREEDDEQEE